MNQLYEDNTLLYYWTVAIIIVALIAVACWAYAICINHKRSTAFGSSGAFSWFDSILDSDTTIKTKNNMLYALVDSLNISKVEASVENPAQLAEEFTQMLHERPWMHQIRGKETLLERIKRAFSDDGENRTYFPAIEQRILAITSMVKASNSSQYMPHLADLAQMTRERDDSRVTVRTFNCISNVVLLMGICGTLYGIDCQLSKTGIPTMDVLRSSLLPSVVSVLAAAILRICREIYQASAESFYTMLDRFTMMVLVPLFQPLTDIKGDSARFGQLIKTLGVFNQDKAIRFFQTLKMLCEALLISEQKIRQIEDVILERLKLLHDAQTTVQQQMLNFAKLLQQYTSLLYKGLALCHGVSLHYNARPAQQLKYISKINQCMRSLQIERQLLHSTESLHYCMLAWKQGIYAYSLLQRAISNLNTNAPSFNSSSLTADSKKLLQYINSTLPNVCDNWNQKLNHPIREESRVLWTKAHTSLCSLQEVCDSAAKMKSPIDDLQALTSQLRDALRMSKAETTHDMSSLNDRMTRLERKLLRIYITKCWKALTKRNIKESSFFFLKWFDLIGTAHKQRLADSLVLSYQILILYIF